jgi:hypothetical protein
MGDNAMARHHLTGVSMTIAIMAAHRAASGSAGAPTVYCQEEIERTQAYLHKVETEQATVAASRRSPQTNVDPDEAGHLISRESMQSCGVHYATNATTLRPFAGRRPG